MTDCKKLIMGFGYRNGKAFSWNGKLEYEGRLKDLARTACDNGADEIFICDRSFSDEDHEAVIGAIKETARTVDEPILAGGRIRRLEDVKKYLYAGASAVFLDVSYEDNVDMMKEAADRFGSEKIYAYLPDLSYLNRVEEYIQLGASMMICRASGPVPTLAELGEIGEISCTSLIFCGGHESVQEMAGDLKLSLGCPQVEGAVLTLAEDDLDKVMELKQILDVLASYLMVDDTGLLCDAYNTTEFGERDCTRIFVEWKNFKLGGDGLIPVIVQDYKTMEVLMMAYMNEESFQATLASGRMTYFSRSRQKLWLKGETSGHFQYVKSLKIDCDNDTILAAVKQVGAACHTGNRSCFFTTLAEKEYKETNPLKVFEEVFGVILDRKEHPKEGSYTNYLFDKGIDKILKKLGEEATEIVIAAKNPNPEEIKYEISDFLYHMMVLMADRGITWEEITEELANR